jgi:hypothetical protein
MTVSVRLSRMAKCHLTAGAIFSIALCAYLLIENYRSIVITALSHVASIRSNTALMAEDTESIGRRQANVRRNLPAGYDTHSSRELMLRSVDKLRAGVKGASVTLEEFLETGGVLKLPVAVEFDTASFEEGVKAIEAIQSFSMPYFEFTNIDIRRLDGSYSSARYKVEGLMTMPAEKITGAFGAGKTS